MQAIVASAQKSLYILGLKKVGFLPATEGIPSFTVSRDAYPFFQFAGRRGESAKVLNFIIFAGAIEPYAAFSTGVEYVRDKLIMAMGFCG